MNPYDSALKENGRLEVDMGGEAAQLWWSVMNRLDIPRPKWALRRQINDLVDFIIKDRGEYIRYEPILQIFRQMPRRA